MLPNYAIMVALACVGGACSTEDHAPQPVANWSHACPPTMRIQIDGTARDLSICNNATFDWLVHTLLAQIAVEKEQVAEKAAIIRDLHKESIKTDQQIRFLNEDKKDLAEENEKLRERNLELLSELDMMRADVGKDSLKAMDCGDIQRFGFRYSGLYTVFPRGAEDGLEVFCDLNTDGGGWLVLQRRFDGSVDFSRDWTEYKKGFGPKSKEFWLGNDNIANLTYQRLYELRVDITDYEGVSGYAHYKKFVMENEKRSYRLRVGGYSGDAGDALGQHDRIHFSTRDVDNDGSKSGHCSQMFGGAAWWYFRCYESNLNGLYGRDLGNKGIVWFTWKDDFTPLKEVEMKIRPLKFRP